MINRYLRLITLVVIGVFISSCATNSALTLINASKQNDPMIPSSSIVHEEFKGTAFELRRIYYDLQSPIEGVDYLQDSMYPKLLRHQLNKGLLVAQVHKGNLPAYFVDIAIEKIKFTKGMFLIPDPSILRVRMEISRPDGTELMKAEFESRYLPTIPVIAAGVVTPIATGMKGQESVALKKMIPAMAVACTKVVRGLQNGIPLNKIEVYPDTLSTGGIIVPDVFLEDEPFGLKRMTTQEIKEVISISK